MDIATLFAHCVDGKGCLNEIIAVQIFGEPWQLIDCISALDTCSKETQSERTPLMPTKSEDWPQLFCEMGI
jgi:hypothetical protein